MIQTIGCIASGTATWAYLRTMQGAHEAQTGLREADSRWHYLAFLVSGKTVLGSKRHLSDTTTFIAGLFAGLTSHVVNAKWVFPRLVSGIASTASRTTSSIPSFTRTATVKAAKPQRTIGPSVGISGALYASLTLIALAFPEAEVQMIFLPLVPIPIQWATGAIITMDIIGVLRGSILGLR